MTAFSNTLCYNVIPLMFALNNKVSNVIYTEKGNTQNDLRMVMPIFLLADHLKYMSLCNPSICCTKSYHSVKVRIWYNLCANYKSNISNAFNKDYLTWKHKTIVFIDFIFCVIPLVDKCSVCPLKCTLIRVEYFRKTDYVTLLQCYTLWSFIG